MPQKALTPKEWARRRNWLIARLRSYKSVTIEVQDLFNHDSILMYGVGELDKHLTIIIKMIENVKTFKQYEAEKRESEL